MSNPEYLFENIGHKQVLAIAVPVILSNITTPLVGLADIAVIGHAVLPQGVSSAVATGSVAFGSTIFSLIFGSFIFFKMGTSGFVAQAKGAGNTGEIAALLLRSLLVAFAVGLLIVLLRQPVVDLIFSIANSSREVQTFSSEYFSVRALAAPFTLMNFVILGWLMGQGRANLGLLVQVILNLTNVLLNLYFVLNLNLAVAGVAWASFVAEIFAFTLSVLIITYIYKPQFFKRQRAGIFNIVQLKRMFSVNRDILIRSMALTFSFAWFTMQSANMGDLTLAANAILFQIVLVIAYFLDGFATSAEVFIGQSVGARNRKIFDRALVLSLGWACVMSSVLALFAYVFGTNIINFMSQDEAVRHYAAAYSFWPSLIALIGVWSYIMDGVFIGATRAADMRNTMLLSLGIYFIAWYVLSSLWGNHGQWMALLLMYFLRGVTLHMRLPALKHEAFKN